MLILDLILKDGKEELTNTLMILMKVLNILTMNFLQLMIV